MMGNRIVWISILTEEETCLNVVAYKRLNGLT